MRKVITFILILHSIFLQAQLQVEIATASASTSDFVFSVGNIYMSGQLESGVIAQAVALSELVSTSDEQKIAINVFPNPANSNLTISYEDLPVKILIYDINGRLVSTIPHDNGTINIDHLNNGLYFIRLGNGIVSSFIKL